MAGHFNLSEGQQHFHLCSLHSLAIWS